MFRLTIFIISLLLLAGAIEGSMAWYITLSVLSGLSLVFCWPFFGMFGRWSWWGRREDRFARRMARRFERRWMWEADW
jgi:hypothetical protein